MVPVKRSRRITQIAEVVTKTEAALAELHHYYKFGRHMSGFPQKPYFLFSHCAHLLFSLWLIEQDKPSGLFAESASLTAILDKLDFAALRYTDYSRRMLYADAYEEHLRNEPKWFKFWVRLLQEVQGTDAASCEEFARQFSVCQTEGSLLEGGLTRRDQRALAALAQGSRAGRLLLHSLWVLEDMVSTASAHIAKHDSESHGIEQMQCLVCLLSQLRGAIVWETSARGPYSLSASSPWGAPSAFDRLLSGRDPGLLTVTLKQEGGEVACTWTSPSAARQRTWVRRVPALSDAYEDTLFKTWPAEAPAHWVVPALEADHLETICKHADGVLEALGRRPAQSRLVETAARILRNGQSQWTATELPWSHVRALDQLIGKLKFACREAKVLGGDNPGEKVIVNLWPPQSAPAPEQARDEASGGIPDGRAVIIAPSGQSGPHEVIRVAEQTPMPAEAKGPEADAKEGPAAKTPGARVTGAADGTPRPSRSGV
jgi:hypothetical protein